MRFPQVSHFVLPNDIRLALGDMTVVWARVEALIAEFLTALLNADAGAMYVLNEDVASGILNEVGKNFERYSIHPTHTG